MFQLTLKPSLVLKLFEKKFSMSLEITCYATAHTVLTSQV